jgi:hypothetical protein
MQDATKLPEPMLQQVLERQAVDRHYNLADVDVNHGALDNADQAPPVPLIGPRGDVDQADCNSCRASLCQDLRDFLELLQHGSERAVANSGLVLSHAELISASRIVVEAIDFLEAEPC